MPPQPRVECLTTSRAGGIHQSLVDEPDKSTTRAPQNHHDDTDRSTTVPALALARGWNRQCPRLERGSDVRACDRDDV